MTDEFTFADQINLLFEQRRHPSGRMYTLQEVSTATGISLPTLSQMRSGRNTNPHLDTLKELGRFFQISLDYFLGTNRTACLSVLHQRNAVPPEISDLTLRAAGLSARAQQDLLTMIGWLQAAEANLVDLPPLESYYDE